MHKAPQPVKRWYFGPFFRQEKPQAGRFRAVLAGRRRGDRLRRPGGRRRDDRRCCDACLRAGRRGRRAAARLARHARDARRRTASKLVALPARARGPSCSEEVARADRPQPAARVRRRHPGTRAVMKDAPLLLDHLTRRGRRALRRGARAPGRRGDLLRDRPDARARHRLLHAHALRVHLRRAGRPVRRRRRRALRRPGEELGLAPTPGIGWAAGIERLLLAGEHRPRAGAGLRLVRGRHRAWPRSRWRAEARRAGLNVAAGAGGPLAQGPDEAGRPIGARYVAILERREGRT